MEPTTPDLLSHVIFGNSILRLLISLGILIGGFLLAWLIRSIFLVQLQKWADKTTTTIDDFVLDVFKKSGVPMMYIWVIYLAVNNIILAANIKSFIDKLAIIIGTIYAIQAVIMLVNYLLLDVLAKKETDETRLKSIKGLMVLIKVLIWAIGLVMLLDNMGYKVSTVVTGLGIGGIAVALAAQAVLGDLFSYISIVFDRPFQLGDTIVVGDVTGIVESIGIKTTRIRSIWGEEIIFSNSMLTSSKIQNMKRMQTRRVLFSIGVAYETPIEVMKQIPAIIKSAVESDKDAKFERAHFKSFGDFSQNFEIVYFISTPDYLRYMDIQQEINFKLAEEFAKKKIEFAYPTQMIYLKK